MFSVSLKILRKIIKVMENNDIKDMYLGRTFSGVY